MPANFMYLWASENDFLQYIPKKYADVIRVKKANQLKVVYLIANNNEDTVKDYTAQIKQAFVNTYDMRPEEALVILAQGGTVAGKNWAEGVFGVGATKVLNFVGHDGITVRTEDGHILQNGMDVTDTTKTVYTTIKKQAVPYQLFATLDGVTYMSQYNKTSKKYYAQTYSTDKGTFNARTGSEVKASDGADLWGTILEFFDKFVNWLISLFSGSDRQLLTAENTLPSQSQDGFVQESGMGEAGTILLLLAAGGLLMGSGMKKSKKA